MRVVLIGPRSIGKSTNGKLLAKRLNLKYISSDDEMDLILKDLGGLKSAFNPENNDVFLERAIKFVYDVYKHDDFLLDLAGGSLYTENSKGEKIDFSLLMNQSIVIGLLPFEDDIKSIELLAKRERTRNHWSELSDNEIFEKTQKHDNKVKFALLKNLKILILIISSLKRCIS